MLSKIPHYIRRYFYKRSHRMFPEISGGFAACGQDIFIANLLNSKREGVFFDIGANDGVSISNSLYFEKELGWSGVAVEPIPSIYTKLKANRNCHLVNGCVTPEAGKARFVEMIGGGTNMLSTLEQFNTGLTARRLRKNTKRHNTESRSFEVDCFTFKTLVEQYGIKQIDFLSVDTEGGELEILKTIDFNETPVSVISVENNYYTSAIKDYLEGCGFILMGTLKVDEIYLYGGAEIAN